MFSNDVSLANGMEQWGLPGRIHITEATLKHLQDKFVVEDSALHERSQSFLGEWCEVTVEASGT